MMQIVAFCGGISALHVENGLVNLTVIYLFEKFEKHCL